MKIRHILVPTDGTLLSSRAVKAAIGLAQATGASITALHVIPAYYPPIYMDGMVPDPALFTEAEYKRWTEASAKRLLARVAKRAQAAGVRFDSRFVTHPLPWKAIIRTAKRCGCDLIVMASHGRRGIGAVVLGSETTRVLTHSRVPVLVVR